MAYCGSTVDSNPLAPNLSLDHGTTINRFLWNPHQLGIAKCRYQRSRVFILAAWSLNFYVVASCLLIPTRMKVEFLNRASTGSFPENSNRPLDWCCRLPRWCFTSQSPQLSRERGVDGASHSGPKGIVLLWVLGNPRVTGSNDLSSCGSNWPVHNKLGSLGMSACRASNHFYLQPLDSVGIGQRAMICPVTDPLGMRVPRFIQPPKKKRRKNVVWEIALRRIDHDWSKK